MKDRQILADLRLKTIKELQGELEAKREQGFWAELEHQQGKLKDYKSLGRRRRQIAQILTVMKEKTKKESQKG